MFRRGKRDVEDRSQLAGLATTGGEPAHRVDAARPLSRLFFKRQSQLLKGSTKSLDAEGRAQVLFQFPQCHVGMLFGRFPNLFCFGGPLGNAIALGGVLRLAQLGSLLLDAASPRFADLQSG